MPHSPSFHPGFAWIKKILISLLLVSIAGTGMGLESAEARTQAKKKAPQGKLIRKDVLRSYEGEYEVKESGKVKKLGKKGRKKPPSKAVRSAQRKSQRQKKSATANSRRPASRVKTAKKTVRSKQRAPASAGRKKAAKPSARKPAARKNESKKQAKRKPVKQARPQAKKQVKLKSKNVKNVRLPYAKETSNERDMPFISVPTSKVVKETQIEMEDPGEKIEPDWDSSSASLPPAEELMTSEPAAGLDAPDATAERTPSSLESMGSETPLSEPASEVYGPPVREPDAFDLHSGADPLAR